jgi:hypothetical protein
MTAYVRRSFPAKKYDILHKREATLRHLIETMAAAGKIHRAAEDVREAHLGVQKALIYYARDVGNIEDINTDQIKTAEADISEWNSFSTDEIIQRYSKSAEQGAAANP